MIDPLQAGHDFESRSLALEQNFAELDTVYMQRVRHALLDNPLLQSEPFYGFVNLWIIELDARGLEALYDPQTFWNPHLDLAKLAEEQSPELRRRLLAALENAEGVHAVIQALCDLVDDPAADQQLLAEAVIPMREVAFSPRSTAGRRVIYEVRAEDDLRSIAAHLYGSPELWPQLVATYDLQPPYLSPTERRGCLSPGMKLSSGESLIPDAEDDALGETMRLNAEAAGSHQEWDIVLAPEGGIATVSGIECLVTDCALRVATPLGDLPEHPTYGLPEVAGLTRSGVNAAQFMLASETLKEDPRVGAVSAGATPNGIKLMGGISIIPASGQVTEYPR